MRHPLIHVGLLICIAGVVLPNREIGGFLLFVGAAVALIGFTLGFRRDR